MRHQSVHLKAAACLCAIAFVGCSDSAPAPSAPMLSAPRTYSSNSAFAATLGSVEFSIDTLDMIARLRIPSTGQDVYSELSASEAAEFAEMTATINHGQAWYTATAVLNPLENAPPGWQPELRSLETGLKAAPSSVRELVELAKVKGPVSLGTLDAKNVRARVVGVLRASDRSPITSIGKVSGRSITSSSSALGSSLAFLNDYPQYDPCKNVATSIAEDRIAFLNSRNWVSDAAVSVVTGQAVNIISRAGKNWIEGPDLLGHFMNVGQSGVEAKIKATALAIKTVLYNSYNCQGIINIQRPIAPKIGYNPGGGGGGSFAKCQEVLVQYEISYNGGLTWSTIEVPGLVCVPDEM